MASNPNQRDATVILSDPSKWIPWYRQIKMQCEALEIWDIVDPEGDIEPSTKPTEPLPPLVSDYEPAATRRNTPSASSVSTRTVRGSARATTQGIVDPVNSIAQTSIIPTRYSELSAEGKEAYDGDSREFRMVFDSYRIRERNYRDERTNIAAIIKHLNITVSPHLQVSCFEEHETLRNWITNLRAAVGVDLDEEIRRVRERYHESLKPMRSPQNWESWLSEYDQAATRAEALKIGDVIQRTLVVDDFLKATSRIAPAWMATFTGAGSDRSNMERRQMMKLFREHMSLAHPTRGKSRSAFMTGEAAHAASGESDSNTQGDASSVQIRAPSTNPSQGNQRQSNKRRMNAPNNKSKQSQKRDTAEAEDICPACDQRHDISTCYYVNPNLETPEWFKPNKHIVKLVQYKLQHDPDLQKAVQEMNLGSKRPRLTTASRSITPHIKTSQTPDSTID
ncbi:gag protein [Paraphaeosphaeria minitans]|uniref:Gag protein n=1 Tax=Paraphaeosphaeria minitans TaxID=565426 RepID=A0A9P6G7A5_9PLEO|nr:gag protein [Paraphaeosphaeria minitans]